MNRELAALARDVSTEPAGQGMLGCMLPRGMRAAGLGVCLGWCLGTACARPIVFNCTGGSQCVRDEIQGFCEDNGFCSFPDDDCPSLRRFGGYAGSWAGRCVEPSVAGTGSEGTGAGDRGSSTGSTSALEGPQTADSTIAFTSESAETIASTQTTETTGSTSSTTSTGTTEATDGSTGSANDPFFDVACVDAYGGAAQFELCNAAGALCTFYVFSGAATCTEVCAAFFGVCEAALSAPQGDCESLDAARDCESAQDSQICSCWL